MEIALIITRDVDELAINILIRLLLSRVIFHVKRQVFCDLLCSSIQKLL